MSTINPSTGQGDGYFVVDKVQARGGYVELFGKVLNTGAGDIRILGGYPDLQVNNTTGREVSFRGVDFSQPGQGTLLIVDDAKGHPTRRSRRKQRQPVRHALQVHGQRRDGDDRQWVGVGEQPDHRHARGDHQGRGRCGPHQVNVFDAPDYQPDTSFRYGWISKVQLNHIKRVYLAHDSWFGFINVNYQVDHWDSIEVVGQPTIAQPGGRYFYSTTVNPNDEYTYTHQAILTGSSGIQTESEGSDASTGSSASASPARTGSGSSRKTHSTSSTPTRSTPTVRSASRSSARRPAR